MNENTQPFSPHDPRLTAYALGELPDDERASVEAALLGDPALQAVVNDIRALGGELTAVLAAESLSPVSARSTAAAGLIVPFPAPIKAASVAAENFSEFDVPRRSKLLRFPGLYYLFATAAAAGFAVLVATRVQVDRAGPRMTITFAENQADERPFATGGTLADSATPGDWDARSAHPTPAEDALQSPKQLSFKSSRLVESTPPGPPPAHAAAPIVSASSAERSAGNTESYSFLAENAFIATSERPVSTFSVDVDTASYSNVRRLLQSGTKPPTDAVRIEELVNYFPYGYSPPETTAHVDGPIAPFAAHLEVAAAPWTPDHRLVRIGLKGREVAAASRGPASLVFLLDVSGSMSATNKLPLVKESLRLLLDQLREDDRVAIVTYAGRSGLALPSTRVARRSEIDRAIESLAPEGSTFGSAGIQLAYDVAQASQVAGGLNRVILCTDGDFNVGQTSEGELVRLIEAKAKSGVFLTVLGFGMGNLKDGTLEKLADRGNGAYGYVDTRSEAKKLLVEQVSGTLVTIAKDVKLQVEFNPARVASYRLIGYENRLLAREDFNNDAIDAGEIGAGHTVTALYEVVPVGRQTAATEGGVTNGLKYSKPLEISPEGASSSDLFTLKVRFKEPTGDVSQKLEFTLADNGETFEEASSDFQFAAAVASFGMVLRDSPHRGKTSFATVGEWARKAAARDPGGYRSEFLGLVRQAEEVIR